jgi:hypothetical protein
MSQAIMTTGYLQPNDEATASSELQNHYSFAVFIVHPGMRPSGALRDIADKSARSLPKNSNFADTNNLQINYYHTVPCHINQSSQSYYSLVDLLHRSLAWPGLLDTILRNRLSMYRAGMDIRFIAATASDGMPLTVTLRIASMARKSAGMVFFIIMKIRSRVSVNDCFLEAAEMLLVVDGEWARF